MAAVNSVSGRVGLGAFGTRGVLMYSAALGGAGGEGAVALQVREAAPGELARLHAHGQAHDERAPLAIACHDPDLLADLLHAAAVSANAAVNVGGADAEATTCELLAASPASPRATASDASDSLGLSDHDSITDCRGGRAGSMERRSSGSNKKVRPKPASPTRQGPQQCQVSPAAAAARAVDDVAALAQLPPDYHDHVNTDLLTVCNKIFGNASALAKHKLTHSDERKYVCGMCSKAFKRQDHLNGHMLTHRNKKPYECKADGCGKSYCDARSLRRHNENHHQPQPIILAVTGSPGESSSGRSQYSGSSEPDSPQRANDAEPTSKSEANDRLMARQLSIINQMVQQQSKQKAAVAAAAAAAAAVCKAARASSAKSQQVKPPATLKSQPLPKAQPGKSQASPKTQNGLVNIDQAQPTHGQQKSSSTSASAPVGAAGATKPAPGDLKPVECNLCHRKFKNIPALNGHMRLHGGYFKKDSDNKKFERKESSGPPLQTASVSVRALIEEKIISRRAHPNQAAGTASTVTDKAVSLTCTSTSAGGARVAFVAPAPPTTAGSVSGAQRRPSGVDFRAPAQPAATTEPSTIAKDCTLIELLKRSSKVKRSISDPGHLSPQQVNFHHGELFEALVAGVAGTADGSSLPTSSGYFSALQEELYHVQDSAILLPSSSEDTTIQFTNPSSLDELTSLDDYATVTAIQEANHTRYPSNRQLEAVLNSPLPESLADFSTYHSSMVESPVDTKDVLSFQKEYIMYTNSPHTGLSAPSPLPSPLSFTYPTPPASHEAQSPSVGSGPVSSLPQGVTHTTDTYIDRNTSHRTDVDEVRNTSSPLSAAFFTATMSSAEEVEEALEEVLPGESIVHGDTLDIYSLGTNSPSSQSPICVTPLPSPLSVRPPTSLSSPSAQNFLPTTGNTFPFQSSETLQSQMMPNSEDPLLSSSPREFGSKKKFDFSGYQSYKIISHGPMDLNNPNVTGILVEANGEFKLIQTSTNQLPVSWLTGSTQPIHVREQSSLCHEVKISTDKSILTSRPMPEAETNSMHPGFSVKLENPETSDEFSVAGLKMEVDSVKQEMICDTFLRDSSSPQRQLKKRPRSERLDGSREAQFASRLRSNCDDIYTPSPILDPARYGSGLYNDFYATGYMATPSPCSRATSSEEGAARYPRINVGARHQAVLPELCSRLSDTALAPQTSSVPELCSAPVRDHACEQLLWDPGINETLDDNEVRMFMELASCAAMPVGGHTREHALRVLGACGGDVHAATLQLMSAAPDADVTAERDQRWTPEEVESFLTGLRLNDKDFYRVAQQVGTKNSKQCVQFYYFWKKVTKEYKSLFLRSWSPDKSSNSTQSSCWAGPASASCSPAPSPSEEFPCRICGKVFNKVKSRSAHMKSHRPMDPAAMSDMKRPRSQPSAQHGSHATQTSNLQNTTHMTNTSQIMHTLQTKNASNIGSATHTSSLTPSSNPSTFNVAHTSAASQISNASQIFHTTHISNASHITKVPHVSSITHSFNMCKPSQSLNPPQVFHVSQSPSALQMLCASQSTSASLPSSSRP